MPPAKENCSNNIKTMRKIENTDDDIGQDESKIFYDEERGLIQIHTEEATESPVHKIKIVNNPTKNIHKQVFTDVDQIVSQNSDIEGKDKFKLENAGNMTFTLPEDETEVDEDCFDDLPDKSDIHLQVSENTGIHTHVSGSEHIETGNVKREENDDSAGEVDSECLNVGSEEDYGDVSWFRWDDEKAIVEHVQKYGRQGIASILRDSLEGWRRHPVNIAIIGQSGKGKSSLINALRNLTEVDRLAAEVGEKETTLECRPYQHPANENIVYWDVPGCGTKCFPSHTYLEKIQIDRYDYFLLVSSERFHELDIWLAVELKKRNKKYYFIRTKTDIDMTNIERRQRLAKRNVNEEEIFRKLKVEVKTGILTALGTADDIHLFLVSNHHPEKYDFPSLLLKMIEDAQVQKRLSLTFGMAGLSRVIIKEKVRALRTRISLIVVLSTYETDFDPFSADIHVLFEELMFCRYVLGLDEKSLNNIAISAGVSVDSLKRGAQLKTLPIASEKDLASLIAEVKKQYMSEKENIVFSIFKIIFGSSKFGKIASNIKTIYSVLGGNLDLMEEEARKVVDFVVSKKTYFTQ